MGKRILLLLLAAAITACGGNIAPQESGAAPSREALAPSSGAPQPQAASDAIEPDAYYLELAEKKEELVEVVADRVEQYRGKTEDLNPNHHEPWPENFPPADDLPVIDGPEDFSIRQTGDPTALAGIYLAVPVAAGFEMRMDAAKFQVEGGKEQWGSGNTFFSHEGAPDWKDWTLSDLDS